MKVSPAAPGKLYETRTGGRRGKQFLVLSIHRAGQRQLALQGFDGRTDSGYATLAEVLNKDWRQLGARVDAPIERLEGEQADLRMVPRRGAAITFMPGAAETAADRLIRSKENLKVTGGARRSFNLTAPALEALQHIRIARQRLTDEQIDDTKIVNSLLIEEGARLESAKKKK